MAKSLTLKLTCSPPALLFFPTYSAVIWKEAALRPLMVQSGWSAGFRSPPGKPGRNLKGLVSRETLWRPHEGQGSALDWIWILNDYPTTREQRGKEKGEDGQHFFCRQKVKALEIEKENWIRRNSQVSHECSAAWIFILCYLTADQTPRVQKPWGFITFAQIEHTTFGEDDDDDAPCIESSPVIYTGISRYWDTDLRPATIQSETVNHD